MTKKPGYLFNRDKEWRTLVEFCERPDPGATLGLVYGRRRQGKTFLLASLVEAAGGFMFSATQQSASQNLRAFSEAYSRHLGRPALYFATWSDAIEALFRLGEESDRPVPVVIDEFSYLMDSVDGIASILQVAMDPGHWAHHSSRVRLILCGSALTTMRGLLGGSAPLRGRAKINVTVHPFDFRNAATFWNVQGNPELAFRINAILGGTPAYRAMVGGAPADLKDFDSWVCRKLLEPNEVIFTEGAVLLHQQPEFVDPALYFSVLAAISQGAHRHAEIAVALDRPANAIGHALSVLQDVRFIERTEDALRHQRPVYSLAEPAIRWHQLIVAPNEAVLSIGRAERVWAAAAATMSSKIYGPHFESLARAWTLEHAGENTLGTLPTAVRPATISCREHPQNHELDVVALHNEPFEAERILAIGEAKATEKLIGDGVLNRLDHIRELLPADRGGMDARLLLFSRSGFTRELIATAKQRKDIELIDLERMFTGT